MNSFDLIVFRWLNSLVFWKDWIDVWIVFKAQFLGWWILGILALLIVVSHNKKEWLKIFFYAVISGVASRFVFAEIIRFFYNRPRPFEVLENINQLLFHSSGGSFPSGHASFFFAVAVSVFFFHRIWGIIFLGMTLYVGIGRIEAGLHWPSDILAGAVVGFVSAWLIQKFLRRKSPP